ncbi:glucan endo-1,3-beta-D-glucosidase 1-like [Rosa rugosa]|uniref:glucan endo-1,3-beta-D-glucosidase 1-like n=1 Tax=Rosa rugosa TaxID=74645 RepID=UPI002B414846|nr:glucan endo-1,3-beta-D-glucosidase 1-like [Rosa rugosa]
MASNNMTLMTFFLIISLAFFILPQTQARVLLSETQATPATGFLFPKAESTVLPDPSPFFAPSLLQTPLPTNSFFQNFVLNNGDQPEYFHPYHFRSSNSSLSLSYPTRLATSASISQNFTPELTISATQNNQERHVVSSFSDLGVTLDFPSSNLRFFLVKGSPYLTCNVSNPTALSISTASSITSLFPNAQRNKYTLKLDNSQTMLVYSSSPIGLTISNPSLITSDAFTGVIRVALLPPGSQDLEAVLDQFSSSYPVSGEAVFTGPFTLEYRWVKEGNGDLLMLAHPLHQQLLSVQDSNATVLDYLKYRSIDGDLLGIVGNSWVLKTQPIPVSWHSITGVKDLVQALPEIKAALSGDVQALISTPVSTTASYEYGKLIAKAARLALIGEEVGVKDIPAITKFLKDAIEPWLSGTFSGNGFLYEGKWGGLVTKNGAVDKGADYGFGVYNDHHFHLGYFLYAISVVAKLDVDWGMKFKDQAYALAGDFMNLNRQPDSSYPRLRNFDLYNLHSWAGGLTVFADGRNQESTSEAVNAYYSAALMGLAYRDTNLTDTASLLAALEIQAAQKWWHVHQGDNIYEDVFASQNKITGIVWSNKRDTGLWFASAESKEIRLGIQVLPISPITEVLFSNASYVREVVDWTIPALNREGVTDAWRGFAYALEGTYNKEEALQKVKNLKGFDDGNSLSNLLWWIHSRG